ncbi:MAG TPA: flagellar biosynthesis protein FlhF [Limnochorda sp.]
MAESMQEAIDRVRAEFGPEAVILQTRTYRRGLFGLLGPRRVEVLAAVDQPVRKAQGPSQPEGAVRTGPAWGARPAAGTPPLGGGPASVPQAPPSAAEERAVLLGRRPLPEAGPAQPPPQPAVSWTPQPAATWANNGSIRQGLGPPGNGHAAAPVAEVTPFGRVQGGTMPQPPAAALVAGADPHWPAGLERVYQRLVDRAVEPHFARRVVEGLAPLVPPGATLPDERLFELARDHLASLIPVSPTVRLGEGQRRVMVLVGPTGVGKTTSLAKLAAHYGLMARHPVGLITFDTYRVGATEQLRTYAEIIGLPMEVVYHPGELEGTLERMADRQLLLVDTAGRSPQDLMRLQELRSYLRLLPDPDVYLVLSATVRYADMVRAVERFEPLGFNHLIITKVDETTAPGMVLNAVFYTGRPLAYLSTGQDVPDDFEAADPDRVAARLLEESDE